MSIMCYDVLGSLLTRKEGKQMERRRRNPQTLTAEQFEVFRTRLDERGNVPPPQPESYMMGEIVRGVYPQLKKLRENGYTLKMLVRVFEENGVVITIHALSTYLKNLGLPREQAPVNAAIKGTVGSPTVEVRPGTFQMKADVTL
jgi:transposase